MDFIPKSEISIKTEATQNNAASTTNSSVASVETEPQFDFVEVKPEATPPVEVEKVEILDFKVADDVENHNVEAERPPVQIQQTKNDLSNVFSQSKSYKCDECTYTTTSFVKLTWHKCIHSNKTVYSCNECAYRTTKRDCFLRHAITHTGIALFTCTICGYSATQKCRYRRHMLSHTGEKPFQCALCNYRTAHKYHLQRHVLTHTCKRPTERNQRQMSKKLFKCNKCNYRTVVEHNFKMHIPTHESSGVSADTPEDQKSCAGEHELLCKVCGFRTGSRCSLKRHMIIHKPKKIVKCKFCDFQIMRKSNLLRHEANHVRGKLFRCKICGFRTSVKGNFQMHLPTHLEEQSDYSSVSRRNLNDFTYWQGDLMVQGTDKFYKCRLCGYRTRYKYHLKRHITTHLQEKPFKCSECTYQTAYKCNLLVHRKNHLMGKVFCCNTCNYKTRVRSNFEMHTHNVKQPEPTALFKNVNVAKRTAQQRKKKPTGSGRQFYKCNVCNYKTLAKHLFEMHTPTHADERKEVFSPQSSEPVSFYISQLEERKYKKKTKDTFFKCLKCKYRTRVERNFQMHIHSSEQQHCAADTTVADISTSSSYQPSATHTTNGILTSHPVTIGATDIGINPGFIYIAAPLQTPDQNYGYQLETFNNVINYVNFY